MIISEMEYLDFDIQVSGITGGIYQISVRSPAGEASERFVLPYNEWELHDRLKDLELALRSSIPTRRVQAPELQSVQEMGRALFDALLPGDARARFEISQRMANEHGKGLRLRLRFQAPELAALPWEYIYNAHEGDYLCLSIYTPIVRYLDLPQAVLPLEVTPPLRVLGMACAPNDPSLAELNLKEEKQRIDTALAALQQQRRVKLHWLPGSTWRDLHQELSRAERAGEGWHIFHLIGHGVYDQRTEEGQVVLVGEDGRADYRPATELARLLDDQHSLRLVVLNTCEGARGSTEDAFSSVAGTLVRRGTAAVVAMQHSISDPAAIELARTFYHNLAEGAPVDLALGEARKAISLALPRTVEWGTPVLFMRSPDGVLFHMQPETSPEAGEALPQRGGHLIAGSENITVGDISNAQNVTIQVFESPEPPAPVVTTKEARESGLTASLAALKKVVLTHKPQMLAAAGAAVLLLLFIIGRNFVFPPSVSPTITVTPTVQEVLPSPTTSPTAAPTASFTPEASTTPTTQITPTSTDQITATSTLPSFTISAIDGMEMIYIPAGEFIMGSSKTDDSNAADDELPQHTVYLDAFWIDKTEVTNGQYARCVAAGACQPPQKVSSITHEHYYDHSDFENYPVVSVVWQDAYNYCTWAGRRLPTEAEWEKAARGSEDARIYPWGNQTPTCELANYKSCTRNTAPQDTALVDSHSAGASPYGVLNMAGNVWEWVNDWYSATYYLSRSTWSNPSGPPSGEKRSFRGSGWDYDTRFLRVSKRWNFNPRTSTQTLGIRCADTPEE